MDHSVNDQIFGTLQLPLQDLSQLSFCGNKPQQVQTWIDSLPTTQPKHMGIIFYKLLPEISRLHCKAAQKIAILERVRQPVQQCIEGLAQDFLEQTLKLPDQAAKIAAIAQALQRHLGDGYLGTCHLLCTDKTLSSSTKKELAMVVSRALYSLGQLLYRNQQLYIPQPCVFWRKLHYLQQVITHYELEDLHVEDTLLEHHQCHRIRDSLLRPLLLNCSHTNQLNQRDITYLYQLLESWCCQAHLVSANTLKNDDTSCLYWVNFHSEQGPMYRHRFTEVNDHTLGINLENLNHTLNTLDLTAAPESENIPEHNKRSLIKHLCHCWQVSQQRKEARTESRTVLNICVGLSAAHAELSQQIPFQQFIDPNAANTDDSELIATANGFQSHTPINRNNHRYSAITQQTKTKTMTAITTDSSDHGYCLKWNKDHEIPSTVKSGEVVIVKQENQSDWQVAIIRWVQRLNHDSYMGIETLSTQATPYAISTTLSNGQESPFFRAIILEQASTQASSGRILTPRIPFAEGQSICLKQNGQQSTAQLTRQLTSTESISHYNYHNLT